MRCLNCNQKFVPKVFLQKFCEDQECISAKLEYQANKMSGAKKPQKPIKKVSDKRSVENLQYSADRIVFLGKPENKICPITKKPTTDVHHKKGRVGSLFLDQRYWVALSREGHKYVEENPEWAKTNGFSLNRLSNE